jgi:hypothetical protein
VTLAETLEFVRFAATIVTPFAVFWLGVMVANRKATIDEIKTRLSEMQKDVSGGRTECREDIQAMMQQMAEYPRRSELHDAIRDLRQDIRSGQPRAPR